MTTHTPLPSTERLDLRPAAGPWVIEIGHADFHRVLTLRQGDRVILGSDPSAGVTLADRTVSARHCELVADQRGLRVVDLDSSNGVYVGAARVREALVTGLGGTFVIGCTSVAARVRSRTEATQECEVPGLIGRSEGMLRVKRLIRRYAKLGAPVLIAGETGTGKDVVARALYEMSDQPGRFVALNGAALADSLVDAELFGHCRGAFTGAVAHREGAFQQAHRGTLFLDEIAELSPAGQAKLLRVVEDGLVRPVGAEAPVRVQTRLVSATLENLRDLAEAGRFRLDLYHRLSTLMIEVPPLRKRSSDVPALAQAYLERILEEVGPRQLSPSAVAKLVAYNWPGNVRQLFKVLYRAAIQAEDGTIAPVDIALPEVKERTPRRLTLEAAEALIAEHGTISAAAREAGMPRTTFRSFLERSGKWST